MSTADIEITGFSSNASHQLQVAYNVLVADVPESFEIEVFRSANGVSFNLADKVGSFTASGSHLLQNGHTVVIDVSEFSDVAEDYYLIAKVDAGNTIEESDEGNNQQVFGGGVFLDGDGIVHFQGAKANDSDDVRVQAHAGNYEVLWNNSAVYTSPSFPELHARTHGGNDTIKVNDSTLPATLWGFGGSGTDNITGGRCGRLH